MSSIRRQLFYSAFIAIAMTGGFQVPICVAADSIDPRVFSSTALRYKADRGIFSAVPDQQVDVRIFSSISNEPENATRNSVQEHVRNRHML